MASTRYQRMDPETQRRILDAARAEFLANGYEAASINRIIQAAGINKGSLYYYFEDKADLFVKLMRAAEETMVAAVADLDLDRVLAEPPRDFWGYFQSASLQKIAFAIRHPDLARLSTEFYFQATKPAAPERFKAFLANAREVLMDLLRMGQAQGAVRDDLPLEMMADLAFRVSDVMNRPILEDLEAISAWGPEEMRRFTEPQVDMLRRMLAPKGEMPQ